MYCQQRVGFEHRLRSAGDIFYFAKPTVNRAWRYQLPPRFCGLLKLRQILQTRSPDQEAAEATEIDSPLWLLKSARAPARKERFLNIFKSIASNTPASLALFSSVNYPDRKIGDIIIKLLWSNLKPKSLAYASKRRYHEYQAHGDSFLNNDETTP